MTHKKHPFHTFLSLPWQGLFLHRKRRVSNTPNFILLFCCFCTFSFQCAVEGNNRRIFPSFLRRQESLPEIIKECKNNLVLCINKEDGKCYIAGRKNICQCPEHIRLNVIENNTGQHIVNNINRYCFFISFGIAKSIVYRFFTGIVHPDDGCPCENSDCNRGQLRADMPIRHAEGNRCQRAGCRITLEIRACDNDGKRRNGADDL